MHVQLHSSATLAWQNGSSECHFGTKLWARPHDVFRIAGSTWFRSLLSKDFRRKVEDGAVDRWGGDWGEVYWCGHTYYTYMTCWSKSERPFREWRSSSSLYLAVVTICWTQNPIVKGENFLFLPLLLAKCFLTVLGETNSQEISLNTAVNRPRKWNLLIMHISVEMSSQAARV